MNLSRNDHPQIREAVASLCRQFDSAYWQEVDEKRAYPEKFVEALTRAMIEVDRPRLEHGAARRLE